VPYQYKYKPSRKSEKLLQGSIA